MSVGAALAVLFALAMIQPAAARQGGAQTAFDVIISGGRIVDGSGSPWFLGDVGISDGRIVRIGSLGGATATRRIDASGLIVAPGFVDPHAHAREGLFELPRAEGYLFQGITTVVDGNDGSSPVPLEPFFAKAEAARFSPNLAMFVGEGSIRQQVMGSANRKATPAEIESMQVAGERCHAGRCARAVHGPRLRARHLLHHGRTDRSRHHRAFARRHLHVTHARRRRRRARLGEGDAADRRRRQDPGPHQPSQGGRPPAVRAERAVAGAARRGAGSRRGRHLRRVSVHRLAHRPQPDLPALGARRRWAEREAGEPESAWRSEERDARLHRGALR